MQKIMFNEPYGLQQAVFDRLKLMTRREPYFGKISKPNSGFYAEGKDKGRLALCDGERVVKKSGYRVGEVVAVAQAYQNIPVDCLPHGVFSMEAYAEQKGWSNKMFVKADYMPHQIRITDIKVERLQDISDEDCMKEGVFESNIDDNAFLVKGIYENKKRMFLTHFYTPQEAFAALIDKVSGKGIWKKNPFCFCYEFEIVK